MITLKLRDVTCMQLLSRHMNLSCKVLATFASLHYLLCIYNGDWLVETGTEFCPDNGPRACVVAADPQMNFFE